MKVLKIANRKFHDLFRLLSGIHGKTVISPRNERSARQQKEYPIFFLWETSEEIIDQQTESPAYVSLEGGNAEVRRLCDRRITAGRPAEEHTVPGFPCLEPLIPSE